MKKVILFGAALAALATFNSCSSEDDIVAQEPTPVLEEPAVVKGIPFSVSAFNTDETRAVRYGANGYEIGSTTNFVDKFKLYGQVGTSEPWLDSYVFTREASDGKWIPTRDKDGIGVSSTLNWGSTDETTFYAVTDNAIATGSGNKIANVTETFNAGTITFALPYKIVADGTSTETTNAEISNTNLGHTSDGEVGWLNADRDPLSSFVGVDSTKINDLMVAYAKKAPTSTDASVELPFKHALSGLSIKAKFNDATWATAGSKCIIYGLRVHGLPTEGTYDFANSTWDTNVGAISYYKTFGTEGVTITAEEAGTSTYYDLVYPGEWLVIPYEAEAATASGTGFPTSGAYVEVLYYDCTDEYLYVGYMPFSIDFKAAKNYTLVLNLTKVINATTGEAQYTPTQTSGN